MCPSISERALNVMRLTQTKKKKPGLDENPGLSRTFPMDFCNHTLPHENRLFSSSMKLLQDKLMQAQTRRIHEGSGRLTTAHDGSFRLMQKCAPSPIYKVSALYYLWAVGTNFTPWLHISSLPVKDPLEHHPDSPDASSAPRHQRNTGKTRQSLAGSPWGSGLHPNTML